MKAAEWKRLSKPTLASTEADWRWTRRLAYIHPVEWIAHGVLAEGSRDPPGEFYLWVVRMPLMAPLGGVFDLSWSDRLGGGTTTYTPGSSAAVNAIAKAAAAAVHDARSGGLVLDPPGGVDNGLMQEVRAYGLLLAGDEAGAREVLWRVGQYDAKYDWEREFLDRAAGIRSLIESRQTAAALQQLQDWRLDNCEALGLACS